MSLIQFTAKSPVLRLALATNLPSITLKWESFCDPSYSLNLQPGNVLDHSV